jgi:hypothetical protein
MTCLDEGTLQARLDGELDDAQLRAVEAHLASCAACRARAEQLSAQAERVRRALAALAPEPASDSLDAHMALARFRAEHVGEATEASWAARIFARRWRPAWAGAALLALIVVCFSFAPARSWAQKILAMLRVQKIAVVPVDFPSLGGPQGPSVQGKMLGQFLSDNVVVTIKPGEPQPATNADNASQLAGFKVRLLGSRPDAPQIKVRGEAAFQMTLNRDRLQGLLDELGRSDLQLPESIDGSLVAVHIPKAVMAIYGSCPKRGPGDAQNPPQTAELANCVMLGQVPSPLVSVPPQLNLQQLAEVGLEAAGMSAQDAQAFCQTVDWTSTLVLPIPRNAGSYDTVNVDGVQGTLIASRGFGNRPPGYVLLWVKDGIVYSLTGFGPADQAVWLADSLQ